MAPYPNAPLEPSFGIVAPVLISSEIFFSFSTLALVISKKLAANAGVAIISTAIDIVTKAAKIFFECINYKDRVDLFMYDLLISMKEQNNLIDSVFGLVGLKWNHYSYMCLNKSELMV